MIEEAMPTFDHAHPIIIKVILSFPKFASACQKFRLIHLFILEIQQILDFYDLKNHAHFPPRLLNNYHRNF